MVKLSASPELSVRSQFIPKVLLNDCNAQDSLNIEGFNIYIYIYAYGFVNCSVDNWFHFTVMLKALNVWRVELGRSPLLIHGHYRWMSCVKCSQLY